MKTEADPITEDEWLLRRVHKTRFRTEKVPLISPSAFEPRIKRRDPDTDGISLFRAACLASPELILATVAPGNRHEWGIVRIQVSALQEMKLKVESKVDSRVAGHVVVPELNSADYATAKSDFKPVMLDLAKLASHDENIVLWPADLT